MIGTLVPKLAKLPPGQTRLWPVLRPSVELGFVLYGGTAISLHLAHRRSVGFDFFCDQALDKDEIRARFAFMERATVLQDAVDTLSVLVPAGHGGNRGGVKISFFGGLGFGRVGEPLLTRDGVLEVASLDDLMAHKLRVILLRPEKKDYEDIAALTRAGQSMARGLAAARAMFGKSFQPAAALKAAVYFEDGDLAALSRTDR
ncbi:MAG: nucleotidyl transferase AbiEii/AbiGii toxin family protein, partial [Betaproteobacteria bacterium]